MSIINIIGEGIFDVLSDTKTTGPSVAIVCNIHGDEPVGRFVSQWISQPGIVRSGRVRIVDGNILSGLAGRRFISRDMNRLFL